MLDPRRECACWLVDTGFGAEASAHRSRCLRELVRRRRAGGAATGVAGGIASGWRCFAASSYLGVVPGVYSPIVAAAVVATKSIAAYRCGFVIDWARAGRRGGGGGGGSGAFFNGDSLLCTSPLLIAFGVHAAARAGLPIQFHVGLGDRDLDLHRASIRCSCSSLLRAARTSAVCRFCCCTAFRTTARPAILRKAFENVYFDVGLAMNHLGVRSVELVAERSS